MPVEKKRWNKNKGNNDSSADDTSGSRNCYYCDKPGHFKRDCKKRKYDEDKKKQNQRLLTYLRNMCIPMSYLC